MSKTPNVHDYLAVLIANMKSLNDDAETRKLTQADFEGPPITRFVCSSCMAITELNGELEQPNARCSCGAEFAAHNGDFIRNTVIRPHITIAS